MNDFLINIPQGFRITFYGGWISPYGVFFPLRYAGDDEYPLAARLNMNNFDPNFATLTQLAYYLGWSKFSYSQNFGGNKINENPNTRRTVTFSFAPSYISFNRSKSILDAAKLCETRFKGLGHMTYALNLITLENVERQITPEDYLTPPDQPRAIAPPPLTVDTTEETKTSRRFTFFKLRLLAAMTKAKANAKPRLY